MPRRFFIEHPISDRVAKLVGAEAHHAARVMRVRVGDEVRLFDGSGVEATGRVARIGRHEIELEIVQRCAVDRELACRLTLGVALPKGERQRWLVEKLVELGVTRLVPLVTERGVAQPETGALDRLRRAVIEAAKQCGRNRLLSVCGPQSLADYLVSTPATAIRLAAHSEGEGALPAPWADAPEVYCAVGPEGGFTADETAACRQAGWQVVSLGPRVLRVETAAVALAAFVSLSLRS